MGLIIGSNTSFFIAQTSLANTTKNLNSSVDKLSTGQKILKAADDASGLSISEKLKSQIRGMDAAKENAQQGNNMLQTVEGDLSVIQDNLQRVRELSLRAANDTFNSVERDAIQLEIEKRLEEIDRIAEKSSFNGQNLLDGSTSELTFQVGANSDSNSKIKANVFGAADSASLGITIDPVDLDDNATIGNFIDEIDTAIENVSKRRSDIGETQNMLNSSFEKLFLNAENLRAANSRIRDTDVAEQSSTMVQDQIRQQASISMLAQMNTLPQMALNLL